MNYGYAIIFAAIAWMFTRRDMSGPDQVAGSAGMWAASPPADDAWLPVIDVEADTMPDQLPTITEAAVVTLQETYAAIPAVLGLSAPPPDTTTAARNERAFLDMIAYAEGTGGPNGYRTLFGGGLVDGLADHPRQFFTFTNKNGETLKTSAAGRYQFLARTWDALARKLYLTDFGPASQDAAALELIRERGALKDVQAGRVAAAVSKVAPIWASLPGAGYAQPERKLSALLASYTSAGGNLEA